MWNAIAFNSYRKFAFYTSVAKWLHPDKYFEDASELFSFIKTHNVTDVHIKPLENGGGREWIIDADYKNVKDEKELMLKIKIGATSFLFFYTKDNVSRVMFSGNRGFHLWLKFANKFQITSSSHVRLHRYRVFEKPNRLDLSKVCTGSFADAVRQAVCLYADEIPIELGTIDDDLEKLILIFWPEVDKNIFCNSSTQIRAPFSYNSKGVKFSNCITQELIDKIERCSIGYGNGG
jgi:hypothetical protein